jgi:acyl-coenzyme A synthetase/AMP-(fatty) acid ligase
MLKVGGLWVSRSRSRTLVAHPTVLECGVVGRQDHDGLVKPMAFAVVLREVPSHGGSWHGAPVRAPAAQRWPVQRPRWVEFVPELPKTATGKIQRFRLRSLVGRQA